jgi:hypothetical protein
MNIKLDGYHTNKVVDNDGFPFTQIVDEWGFPLAMARDYREHDEFAERIVACLNYCAGMTTADLTNTRLLTLIENRAEIAKQRDILRAALTEINNGDTMADVVDYTHADVIQRHYKIARNALAKIGGQS